MKTVSNVRAMRKSARERFLRDNRGMLQRVADRTGVTVATVSRVYHGKIVASPDILRALDEEIESIRAQNAA